MSGRLASQGSEMDGAKRCYYEVLGCTRTANEAELKVAYRKLALKWHPDKNLDNQEATAIFQEIQNAYSVLSDSQERAWYDSHRDEILRGGDGQGGVDDPDAFVVNVWPFFSGSAYSGYEDGEKGFYAVYRGVFEKVDAREAEGVGLDHIPAPSFGQSDAEWGNVCAFYGHWSNFVSRLSFGWADEYREQDAPSRQVRRAMEKENKKLRDVAKRKYNDTIRALVEYIRKRDKRVIKHQIETQRLEAERARLEAESAKARAVEFKKERAEWLKQQQKIWEEEEAVREEAEKAGGRVAYRLADESDDSDDDAEQRGRGKSKKKAGKGRWAKANAPEVIYECVICGNTFKSEKQKANHEKSRAHRKMVESLKQEFGDQCLDSMHPDEDEEEEEEGEGKKTAGKEKDDGIKEEEEGGQGKGGGAGGEAAASVEDGPATVPGAEGDKAPQVSAPGGDPPAREDGEEEEEEEEEEESESEEEDVRPANRFASGFAGLAMGSSSDSESDSD